MNKEAAETDAPRLLLVEDTQLLLKMLRKALEDNTPFTVDTAASLAEARALLEGDDSPNYYLAVLDLNLPDAPDGEIVSFVARFNIPSVVFTGSYSDELRERMIRFRVVDYVVKRSTYSVEHLVHLAKRLWANRKVKVLVVDDSAMARSLIRQLLVRHQFQVIEAKDGQEGLETLAAHPNIRMVITDYNMPKMDGFKLTQKLRARFSKEKLGIIGLSGVSDKLVSAGFLKHGANDFLKKPFLEEELLCRITQNVENIELIEALREIATRDFLTRLPNRRCFFDEGIKLFSAAKRGGRPLGMAMLDVDFFKKFNDTHGHDAGDEVLRVMGRLLWDQFGAEALPARLGGEEFAVLLPEADVEAAFEQMETIRRQVEAETILFGEERLNVTVSIGLCNDLSVPDLEAMITEADAALYQAKQSGRNRVARTEG